MTDEDRDEARASAVPSRLLLRMEADGTRMVVAQCHKPPRRLLLKTRAYIYECLLFEADGTTQLMQASGKPHEAIGFLQTDALDRSPSGFIRAWFPDESMVGDAEFNIDRMVGRKCVVKVRYDKKPEPMLRVVRCVDRFPPRGDLLVNQRRLRVVR